MSLDFPPPPPPVVTSAQCIEDAKADLDRALRTPSCVKRLRDAAAGTTRKIQDSDLRICDLLKLQEELEASRRAKKEEGSQ